MLLTKTTEYAIRVLIYMAAQDQELYKASELSETLKIPYKYLSHILTKLTDKQFITSIKGRGGGYKIAKPLNKITLYDIVVAVEGPQTLTKCILGFDDCNPQNPCALHYIWEKNRAAIIKTMKETTLETFKQNRQKIKRY